jgi:poly(beta-D-mannuronate) lyase
VDCLIANNLIVSPHGPLVRVEDEPVGTRWLANIYYGSKLGLPPTEGLREANPFLVKGADELWRPLATSPVIGAAEGEFAEVTNDIQGNPRGSAKDIGCFQSPSREAGILPAGRIGTGPSWE